ncbi:MAG: PAS domain-containing protein, partial [Parvularcula sp.]|nr:PAS domain-containing protein [Parvularcula sp.]
MTRSRNKVEDKAPVAQQQTEAKRDGPPRSSGPFDPLVLARLFDTAPALVAVHEGPEHRYVYSNPLHDQAVDNRPLIGRILTEAMPELEGQGIFEHFDEAYRTGEPIERPEFQASVATGEDGRLVSRWYRQVLQPFQDEAGATIGILSFAYDITEQVDARNRAERSEAALQKSNQRFRAAIEAISGILWTNTAVGEMRGEQPGWSALTGQTFEEYQGYGWANAVHPEDAQPTIDAWNEAVRERKMFVFEHRLCQHDGRYRLYSIRAIPLFDAEGKIREWVGVHTDITEQRQYEKRLRLLNRELNHRVKNLFAIMQSLIGLSAAGESDVGSFTKKLRARVEALAAAHLISLDDDEPQSCSLRDIVAAILQPYDDEGRVRLRMEGEHVTVPPHAVTPFGLILHELATNAVKHGAWATPHGTLQIEWQRIVDENAPNEARLDFQWREIGRKEASSPTGQANGFGTRLIEGSTVQLGGELHRSLD